MILIAIVSFHCVSLCMIFIKEAFIRNFSAPYSLLQRYLVGEEERKGGQRESSHPDNHQHSHPRPLITELTTSSFLPSVMDLQKVRKDFHPHHIHSVSIHVKDSALLHVLDNGRNIILNQSNSNDKIIQIMHNVY